MLIKRISDVVAFFRPSFKGMIIESWIKAKGLKIIDAGRYALFGYPHCYVCGRKQDFIFDFVKLIPFFDMSLDNKLVYICDDHGRVTDYNCITGDSVILPLPRPYWYRIIRNTLQFFVLYSVYVSRFVWIFVCDIFMWYVGVWFYCAWKELRQTNAS